MGKRNTHEWYTDGGGNWLCRHCGVRTTDKEIAQKKETRCESIRNEKLPLSKTECEIGEK